jgi:hypothetical protein
MPTVTLARATGDVTTSATTFSDVTGLTFALAINTDYYFRFIVHHSSAATTTGIRFAVNGPASPTALRVGGVIPISTVAANFGSQTAYDTAIFASTTGTTVAVMSVIEGIIRNAGNTGTLALRVAAEVAATVTVLTNSHGVLIN